MLFINPMMQYVIFVDIFAHIMNEWSCDYNCISVMKNVVLLKLFGKLVCISVTVSLVK